MNEKKFSSFLNYGSAVWLVFLILFSSAAALRAGSIESFTLSRVLHPGFDAFGRDCLLLSFLSAFQTLKTVIPIAFLCLGGSLLVSFLITLRPGSFSFFWNTGLDTLSALPGLLIALSLSVFFHSQFFTVFFAAALIVVPYLVRFFESQILVLRHQEYILSAEALGATRFDVFRRHYLPELAHALLAILPFLMTRLILIETSLSFFGLNSHLKHESWGSLLYQGKEYLVEAPWIAFLVATPLFLTLLSLHLLSKSLSSGAQVS